MVAAGGVAEAFRRGPRGVPGPAGRGRGRHARPARRGRSTPAPTSILLDNMTTEAAARGGRRSPLAVPGSRPVGRPHPRPRPRGRRDRRRLPRRRRAHPLGPRPRHRARPPDDAARPRSSRRDRRCARTSQPRTGSGCFDGGDAACEHWRRVDRRAANRRRVGAADPRPARPGTRRLADAGGAVASALDRPGRAARAARHDRAPTSPRRPHRRRRSPACKTGAAGADGQPARGRHRPDRQRRWPRSQLFGGPCIVVDFGTATTFDVVNPRGRVRRRCDRARHRDLPRGARPRAAHSCARSSCVRPRS